MERHLHLPHIKLQAPDWFAALTSGVVAGAALMILTLLWAATDMNTHPWIIAHRIAAITMGQQVLASSEFSASVMAMMAITHYGLGIFFALILAAIVAALHMDDSPAKVVGVGGLFGLALYLVNFYLLIDFYPWFMDARGGDTLIAHLIFGLLTAGIYSKLERRSTAP
jgi:hypothetical protein